MDAISLHLAHAFVIGMGASLLMDGWSIVLRQLGIPTWYYAMLGRWCGHWRNGVWAHASINKTPAVRGEKPLGWALHELSGIALA